MDPTALIGLLEFFDDPIMLIVIVVVVGGILLKALFWIILIASAIFGARSQVRAHQEYQTAVQSYYNQALEDSLRRLAWMQQQQQAAAERAALQRRIEQQVRSLPKRGRKVYREILDQVVDERMRYNPETGELERS